jgi:HAE1 family hydrophobic/amphiphilic exporter-1
MVGGLIVSQALTLFTTPVVYLYLDNLSNALTRWTGANRDKAVASSHVSSPRVSEPGRQKDAAE